MISEEKYLVLDTKDDDDETKISLDEHNNHDSFSNKDSSIQQSIESNHTEPISTKPNSKSNLIHALARLHFVLLSGGIIADLIGVNDNSSWYHRMIEVMWLTCAVITWGFCYWHGYGIPLFVPKIPFTFDSRYVCEIIAFSALFIPCILVARFLSFASSICPSSETVDHIIGSLGAFITNSLSMYGITFYLLCLNLSYVQEFNHLIDKIETNIKNDIDMVEIESKYFKIKNQFKYIKKQWQFIVSIWCVYNGLFALVSFMAWIFEASRNSWALCYHDPATQIIIVIGRSTVRIFGLLYSIVRLNRKPHELAKVLRDYYENSKDIKAEQLMKIILTPSSIGFKVCWCKINMKHIRNITAGSVLLFIGSVFKIGLSDYL